MCNTSNFQFKLALFVAVFNLVSSCLITNCPRGGKRAGSGSGQTDLTSCTPCGPNRLGVCVGPNICCGKHIGCLVATTHTRICQRVRDFKETCLGSFATCGDEGRCVAKDVCCSMSDCKMDKSCKIIPFSERDDYIEPFASNRFTSLFPLETSLIATGRLMNEPLESKEESVQSNYNFRSSES